MAGSTSQVHMAKGLTKPEVRAPCEGREQEEGRAAQETYTCLSMVLQGLAVSCQRHGKWVNCGRMAFPQTLGSPDTWGKYPHTFKIVFLRPDSGGSGL